MKVLLLFVASLLAFKANSQNKPVISGNDFTTCFGRQGCIFITTSDADNDSVDIWWDNSIAGGILTHTNNVKRFSTGSVCYTPSGRFYPDTAEQFTVYATDGTDTVSKTFTFTIKTTPIAKPEIVQTGNRFDINMKADTTTPWSLYDSLTFELIGYDDTNNIFFTYMGDSSIHTIFAPTLHRIRILSFYRTSSCFYTVVDTFQSGLPMGVKRLQNTASIYPNPATTSVTISYSYEPGGVATITDVSGKAIIRANITAMKQEVDVQSLTDGIYFILIHNKEGELIAVEKLLKE